MSRESVSKQDSRKQEGVNSRLPGFHRLGIRGRLRRLASIIPLSNREQESMIKGSLPPGIADLLIENVVGTFGLPLGVAANFRINGRDYLIPMVVEETSIVAAASGAARLVRQHGTLTSEASEPLMIGQIQLVGIPDFDRAEEAILEREEKLLALARKQDRTLVELGGGPRELQLRRLDTREGPMLMAHLVVDVQDAMGANAVNSMVEALGPELARLSGGQVICRIVSNLSDRRTVRARMEIPVSALNREDLLGANVAHRIVLASALAEADPYRAATHNKGVMNAVDAVLLATGNDWRAAEAGAHAYAARSGQYSSLTRFQIQDERLIGELELPLAVGTVGGVTRLHPMVKLTHRILRVQTASELAEVAAAAGLLQNFAALRSLVTDGIQRGHMSLHAQNLARSAGARGRLVRRIAERMIREGRVQYDRAREIVRSLKDPEVPESA